MIRNDIYSIKILLENIYIIQIQKKFTAGATINLANDSEIPDPATVAPKMDGTAAVGSSNKYAREDHVHPSDNTKQDTLVSGESIRTINNLSLLGDGNINVGDVPSITVENEQIPNETDFNRVAEAAAMIEQF